MKLWTVPKSVFTLLLFIATVSHPQIAHADVRLVPAFPGAEGYGSLTPGGRGGRVIAVTNLHDSGPGTLREAIDAEGARIVVFRVGGTILLESELKIKNPYITIAGQTAPGDGILLRNVPSNIETPLKVKTHDVIIRYIRSRPGASTVATDKLDALGISNENGVVYNVVIDHSSFSWATDEVINIWHNAHYITVQWSIIAEGLNCSNHPEGCHSKGMLIGNESSSYVTVHHNLFAHNAERNPRVKTAGAVDVVNNIVYNPGSTGGWGPSHVSGYPHVNYVGNYYIPGVDTSTTDYYISIDDAPTLGVWGNITPLRTTLEQDELIGVVREEDHPRVVKSRDLATISSATSALDAYTPVLNQAGASIGLNCDGTSYMRRDAVDIRIADDVRNGTGNIIDDPTEVDGWPVIADGTPCPDGDEDGMPDAWETLHNFDPANGTDGNGDADADGYTNIEEFLNSSNPYHEDTRVLSFSIYLPALVKN